MKKPTQSLNFKILKFLSNDASLSTMLKVRDEDNKTIGIKLTCKFLMKDEDNHNKSKYRVDFIYKTMETKKKNSDDISVLIEVHNNKSPGIKILDITKS